MKKSCARGLRNCSVILIPLILVALGVGPCYEPPPCEELPQTMMGEFDGVLYYPEFGGQMFAFWSELCVNVEGDVTYITNSDFMQTVVIRDEIEGLDLYVIYQGNFKEPWQWDGGSEIIVLVDSAIESAETGEPIPLDGYEAVGYYWVDGYWDIETEPDYMTASGEITFDVACIVPGGFIGAAFSGELVPY